MVPRREFRLRRHVQRVRIRRQQLLQLRPEVRHVRREVFFGHDPPAALFELGRRRSPHALGVVGRLGDGRQRANPVGPQHVARADADLDVADLRAKNVVAGVGNVGVAGQAGEQDDPVRLGQRRDAQHGAAA